MQPLAGDWNAEPQAAGATGSERVTDILELAALSLEETRFRAAATGVVTELATRLACERVSLGFERRGRIRIEALSHSANFDERTNLIRDLGAAMDEAADQDATIVFPSTVEISRVTRAHAQLSHDHGTEAVCSVPLAYGGRIVGALTLERRDAPPFDVDSIELLEDVASLLGPILYLKRRVDARLFERMREWIRERAARLFGSDHPTLKLTVALVAGILLFLAFAKGTYRVTAEATLEGRVQRVVVAGLDGYIAAASARAGDLVRRGQVMGQLDERDLLLERRKWAGRREQLRKEHREALAGHARAEVNILSAKLAQAEAQLELLEENLERTRLVAPFEGIVVRGDLSQSLGSPVERGDVLFEIAPLDGYRIILEVDERDVGAVLEGMRGRLVLSAQPGRALPLIVERSTAVASAEDGRNFFRVEARLEQPADSLRPGMEGIAKIEIDRRRLLWIWTHRLVDWLRLALWSWWP